jgi:dipeptidyl aminopeptidase/acylaminoacyl peptidase
MGSRSMHALSLVLPAIVLSAPVVAQPRQSLAVPASRPALASFPGVLVSPDGSKLLVMERTAPSIDGATGRTFSALVVQPIGRGEIRRLILPWRARVRSVFWAPDGDRIGFTILEDHGISLWVGDAYTGVIRMLAGPVLSMARGEPCQWFHSGESLLCTLIPADPPQGIAAAGSLRPPGASQLVAYPVDGNERRLGQPASFGEISISPDGNYLVVETAEGGTSSRIEVWDAKSGEVLRVVQGQGSLESRTKPTNAVVSGPRSIEWRGDKPATLVWVEAQDRGSPATGAKIRDRLFQLPSPFTGVPAPFAALEFRSRGVVWGGDGLAVVSEGWGEPRVARSWIVNPDRASAPRLLQGLSGRGADPGSFLTRRKRGGGDVLLTAREGQVAYLLDPSYLDEIDLATGRTQRLWRPQAPFREEVVGVIDADERRIIVRRGSASQPENYFVRDLRKNKIVALTNFK